MDRQLTRRACLIRMSLTTLGVFRAGHLLAADVDSAEAAGRRTRVIRACSSHWQDNKGDCSAFVNAVAKDLGISLTGNANAIYDQISASPWVRLGIGPKSVAAAGVAAYEGKLVIAARRGKPNGQVAVIVDYRNAFDSYAPAEQYKAIAFWGNLDTVGDQYKKITTAFTRKQFSEVLLASIAI